MEPCRGYLYMNFAVHIIACEQAIIRNGIRNVLAGLEVRNIQEAADSGELIRLVSGQDSAFAVVTNTVFSALPVEIREDKSMRFLVVTEFAEVSMFSLVREFDVSGVILASAGLEEWSFALSRVLRGEKYISTDFILRVNPQQSLRSKVENNITLTAREKKILQLVAEGFTNKQIADRIFASQRTVEAHRMRLIGKTGARNTATLVKMAVQKGLVD